MIPAILLSPLGRRVIGALLICAALAGAAFYLYQRGQEAGRSTEAARLLEENQKQRVEREFAALKLAVAAAATKEAEAAAEAEKQARRAHAADQALVATLRLREQEREAVAAVPDDGLAADIARKLALRPPEEAGPLMPAELRRVDEIVTDYPLARRENDELREKLAALDGRLAAVDARLAAVEQQRDAWKTWAGQLQVHYAQAYNAIPKRGNRLMRILTFGRAGKAKPIKFPSPDEVLAKQPK